MTIAGDMAELCPHTVTHAPLASRDGFGAPTYGAGTAYAARLVRKQRVVRTPSGDEVVATGELWIAGTPTVGADDRITLPDATTPDILAVETYPDEAGTAFVKVFFR